MCGILGALGPPATLSEAELRQGLERLAHRGPDAEGVFLDREAGVMLGHRRLAILDLSTAGHQPMHSPSRRFVLVYNGEIYNFRELRRELEGLGHRFRGHCDTEVMLAAIEHWGVEAAVHRFLGMFAFALWDRAERRLWLGRDRLGKKPLYIALFGASLMFASELEALHAFAAFRPTVDRDSLALFLRYRYVPDPRSIYREVVKLPPGHLLAVAPEELAGTTVAGLLARAVRYWSAREVALAGRRRPVTDAAEARERLDALLEEAVACRMIADVPLGALLSGGIDSSLVIALMQARSSRPVRSFTIAFDDPAYDESAFAAAIARHLGTEHRELRVTAADALDLVPSLPVMFDEPLGDASAIPTALVCRLARREVTVALSGDGGDETFGGYNRYFRALREARVLRIPRWLRTPAARGLDLLTALCGAAGLRAKGLAKRADRIRHRDLAALYRHRLSHWERAERLVPAAGPAEMPAFASPPPPLGDPAHYMMWLDTESYLPGDVLVKVDRASMAASLEIRSPLLDHRVVEFAWRLPASLKIRDGVGKRILRRLLGRRLPAELFERPKRGFNVPLAAWLRGPLRDWAESLLDERRLREEGFLDPYPIRACWKEHLAGRRNWGHALWDVLVFQAWLEHWHGGGRAASGGPGSLT